MTVRAFPEQCVPFLNMLEGMQQPVHSMSMPQHASFAVKTMQRDGRLVFLYIRVNAKPHLKGWSFCTSVSMLNLI